ncbi:MAG: PilZ domain-containing protein [Deltaproteobacteria bacterium]|nr:PilZ domain-containing protein [Deltaproteobacteria bacterium]
MKPKEERRHDNRVQTRFESLISMGRSEGVGVLTDISYSGAYIEEATCVPEVGEEIRLYVFVHPVSPFHIEGKVVRQDNAAFAVEYKDLDPEICRLVDDAAAVVRVPKK